MTTSRKGAVGSGRPTTLPELLDDLAALPAVDRARLGRLLADGRTARAVRAVADAAVWELTRQHDRATVARMLGVSAAAVGKAVTAHRRRTDSEETP